MSPLEFAEIQVFDPLHHHREVSVVSSFGAFWSEGRVAILHFSRRAMAFLWSSSSVRAYRPPAKPSFPLSEIASITMRLHLEVRLQVTELQHPGKSPVTLRRRPRGRPLRRKLRRGRPLRPEDRSLRTAQPRRARVARQRRRHPETKPRLPHGR